MHKEWVTGCAFALSMGAASSSLAGDNEFSVGVGVDYSTGKYGTANETKVVSIPFMARYDAERWTLKLTVPFLSITGPANVIPGVGSFDSSGRPRRRTFAGTQTQSGLGDTVASATYNAH